MSMSEGNFQGRLSYDITPYWIEIINNLSPYSGFEELVLMAAAQGGKTKAIIEALICFFISQHPCNIGYISGNTDLALESMIDLDKAIKNASINHLIRPSTLRTRNSRSGDTNKMKEYPGGNLIGGSATNHKTFRRRNWRLIIADDIEEANDQSAKAGSTVEIIKKRANSYGKTKKIFWCSTPLREAGSIIYPLYKKGDQRKYHIPCQRCGAAIHLEWEIHKDEKEKAGITWLYDTNGKLKAGSVEYICQECGRGFSEKNKYKFNKDGLWVPTAEPETDALISYYWNNLYSAPGMDNWDTIVREYISANPVGQPRNERAMQTFWNLRMGLPYTQAGESPKASMIRENMRPYAIGTVPTLLSQKDGNGKIILLTFACDLNGIVDDARIDFEVVGHAENGATYSIIHGSVGTFIPREKTRVDRVDRKKWSYEFGKENSVWGELDRVMREAYPGDDGLFYQPNMPSIDLGHLADYVWTFVDWTIGKYPGNPAVGIRGLKDEKYKLHGGNDKIFSVGQARTDSYFVQVGLVKDTVSNYMQLKWDREKESQPPNYMNYPLPDPEKKLYLYEGFFKHYESEERTQQQDKDGMMFFRWEKKNAAVQNHFWDCRIYNIANREIIVKELGKQLKQKQFEWPDYVTYYNS